MKLRLILSGAMFLLGASLTSMGNKPTQQMRKITLIIVHCSATPEGVDYSVKDIDRWHRARGWNGCGYHYVVRLDGTIEQGRPEEVVGAHCKNHNLHSIGVCYIGGIPARPSQRGGERQEASDTRTPAQKAALQKLLTELKTRYPNAIIVGHNVFAHKACPCYDAVHEYLELQPK